MTDPRTPSSGKPDPRREVPVDDIRRAIESIRFGTVQIVVQDGRVVQIDKTEKIRLV